MYYLSLNDRRPFSNPSDPGFLVAMTMHRSRRKRHRRSFSSGQWQRLCIWLLVVQVVLASAYPSVLFAASFGKTSGSAQSPHSRRSWSKNYVPGEVLVKFKESSIDLSNAGGVAASRVFAEGKNLSVKDTLGEQNMSVLAVNNSASVESTVAQLEADPNVVYAEPNFVRTFAAIDTDDTYRDLLWGLDNTGQTIKGFTGTADADIDAPEAWAVSEGSNAVIVAVLDSGVAYNHPELLPNMWDGTNCKDENGEALGYCQHGYDYADNDKDPLSVSIDHGTHVAGTIAAVKGNGKGVIGVAPKATIMALRIGNFFIDTAAIIKAIDFARQNGAKIINASFGGYDFSQAEFDAIDRFRTAGGLFVAAAGNDSDNNDINAHYPSGYDLDNIISIAATDANDELADGLSNYGALSVDVGAPGVNIYSTIFTSETTTTQVAEENFDGTTPPALPSAWTPSGDNQAWGTEVMNDSNVLSSTLTRLPYADNADTKLLSPVYDLRGLESVSMDFDIRCETEYTDAFFGESSDYLALEMSSDGTAFDETMRWNEPFLDDDTNSDNAPLFSNVGGPIYTEFLTNTFQYRFRWVTNATDNNHEGCSVDNIRIENSTVTIGDGSEEAYGYKTGTSMAAPHVAGLSALLLGYRPELTTEQVKKIILGTGDLKDSLQGKTTSGRRINAANALRVFQLAGGFTAENTIPAEGGISRVMDGSGMVSLNFRVRGWGEAKSVTLNNFEYSTDNGTTWTAPTNGDASTALDEAVFVPPPQVPETPIAPPEPGTTTPAPMPSPAPSLSPVPFVPPSSSSPVGMPPIMAPPGTPPFIPTWQDHGYVTSLNFDGTAYAFTFSTKHPDAVGLVNASYNDVKFRFKVTDGTNTSAFVETERIAIDNVSPVITMLGEARVTLALGDSYTDAGATASDDIDGDLTSKISTSTFKPIDTNVAGTYVITYRVSDLAGNTTIAKRKIKVLPTITSGQVALAPEMALDVTQRDVVMGGSDVTSAVVSVPADVTDARLDVTTLVEQIDETTKSALLSAITVNAETSIGSVQMQMPSAVQVSAPLAWTGMINAPQVQATSAVTLPSEEGQTAVSFAVIEVGAGDIPLTLTKAARLTIPGQAGKRAGYERGGLFTAIGTKCSADMQVVGDALSEGGDCSLDVGKDLVIWTKHFTRFVTYQLAGRSRVIRDPAPESVGVAIAEGTTTSNPAVTLTMTYGADIIEMAFSPYDDFRGAFPEAATSTRAWTFDMSDGDGQKTVYVMFRNADGGRVAKSATITVARQSGGAPVSGVANTVTAAPSAPAPETPVTSPTPSAPLPPEPRVLGVEKVNVVALEKERLTFVDRRIAQMFKGKSLASSESPDALWYIDPVSLQKFHVADSRSAFRMLGKFGLGISNADLAKIPVSTDPSTSMTPLAKRLRGRILLQVQSRGEAWYVNPDDGKRYYISTGSRAYEFFHSRQSTIPAADFRKIDVGDLG